MPFLRRRTRELIRDEYEDAAHAAALSPIAVLVGILIIAFIAGAVALVIWLLTASSAARGNAGVTRQHNSPQNQIAQNTKLLGDSATIVSDQQKIRVLTASQVTEQDRIDLAGLEQNCQSDVAAYNADAQNILAAGLLPAGLPTAYPVTVCEVTAS
jgi:flagellar basal body-associated protein FliL